MTPIFLRTFCCFPRLPWLIFLAVTVGGLLPAAGMEAASPLRVWRYIVIHHSGAASGNEAIIEAEHLRRGMENGMAYHFLIGNGSAGLGDGEVVEGRRWKRQIQGGHAHQDYLNECGIGICLVGNLNLRAPTERQMRSLTQLVLKLQERFQIPDDNIHGHGEFYGEDSECPGHFFNWVVFRERLNALYLAQGGASSETPVRTEQAAHPALKQP